MRRALFLDRDGIINIDHGYVGRVQDFDEMPGIVDLMRAAADARYAIIVVTNQSGIARGYFDIEAYKALEQHIRHHFAAQGIELTDVYYCPHHPEGIVAEFAITCSCRKPAPGLILQAAREHEIDLSQSILVGDKSSDIDAAVAAGVGRPILVKAGGQFAEVFAALEQS